MASEIKTGTIHDYRTNDWKSCKKCETLLAKGQVTEKELMEVHLGYGQPFKPY